ncbi:FUSC family protein [Streptomyces sp. OE57]|uniref:FUSC family protein n=1 Tax=Streptomyces lacaronensis TaxID=3379885 RepID=UPI0039B77C3B
MTITAEDTTAATPNTSTGYAPHRVGGPRRWWDWVLAADPGLGQLQAGWRALVCMTTALAVGYWMAHALDIPAMLGMMVGGMMGMMSSFVIAENTPLRLARASLWMAFPYSAALPAAAWLSSHRVLELCVLVVVLAFAFFLVRFGSLGLLTGMMMFNAFVVGAIVHIPLGECDKLFAVAVVTSVAVLAARLLLCYPMPREDLLRTQRAFLVEARRVADAAATALDPDADQATAVKKMGRALRRLNVTTVIIDGCLARPEVAADPEAAELLHQHLFDAELALQGIGQSVQQMTSRNVPVRLREAMVIGLVIARDTHLGGADALRPAAELIRQQAAAAPQGASAEEAEVRALARRTADLLDALADALARWLDLGRDASAVRAKVPFQPTVALERNRPSGAGPAAQRVSAAQADRGWRRAVPYLRAPLQAGIAAAIVCPIADALDGRRFYWGLIGVMITLFGTNTTHERLRKLGHRVVGTVAGAVIGLVLLHLIGPGHIHWTLLVIVVGLTLGSWGMQRQYAYWVTGLVAALVQLYGLTAPSGDMEWLLTERLLDNALGIVVATACAAVIFPVSTRKVARETQRGYLAALEHLIVQVAERWKDPEAPVRLRGATRGVDAALLQVQNVVRPLVRMPLGVGGRSGENKLALLGTATRHAHALAVAADIDIDLAPPLRDRVERVTEVFATSLHALDRQVETGERGGTWVRVSPMIRELESVLRALAGPRADRLHTALRELAALDEVLATLAEHRGLTATTLPGPSADDRPASPAPSATREDRRTHQALRAWAATTRRDAAPPKAVTPQATAPRTETPQSTVAASRKSAEATSAGTATVSGTLRCPVHPDGCEAWITVVTDRGKRQALVRAAGGSYRIPDLAPGGYTLIVSSPEHAPSARFLVVEDRPGRDLRQDITLEPAT